MAISQLGLWIIRGVPVESSSNVVRRPGRGVRDSYWHVHVAACGLWSALKVRPRTSAGDKNRTKFPLQRNDFVPLRTYSTSGADYIFAPVAAAHVPGEESKAKRNHMTNTTTNKALTLVAAVLFSVSAGLGPDEPSQKVSGGHALIPVIRPGAAYPVRRSVDLGRSALNHRFELAFQYSLTDGRSGIAIASFHGEREGDGE